MAEKRKIRILLAASEAVPFAKTGGLGDVAGSLPKALNAAGADCSVILPLYGTIPAEYVEQMTHVADFYVPLAWRNVYCGIERLTYGGVNFYFVDNEAYFKRDGLYGYFDDGERFAFFSKAICEAIQWLPELQVDVLHCNDWQTAMAPVFIREFYQGSDACRHVKTIFTVHNVKFQGQFSANVLGDILGLADNPAAAGQLYVDRDSINYMKGALCYSDLITTVSPSYANELQMPFYGEGMDDIFRRRSSSLRGILNGIDTDVWNPATDSKIEADYRLGDMAGKAADKAALQRELGLREDPERPLVVMIGRLTNQKGLGLVRYAMNRLMERSVQVAVLGTGDKDQEDAFKYFDWTYGDMMAARIEFDSDLSHRMYAGGDILLMPSEFEPCGLSQMIAMRYGTLPVVRETGGLQDSVVPYNKYTGEGTGFRFANMNADEMADTLLDACEVFWTNKDAWHQLQRQAMETDFSWKVAAGQYLDAYYDLTPELDRADCKPDVPEQDGEGAGDAKAKQSKPAVAVSADVLTAKVAGKPAGKPAPTKQEEPKPEVAQPKPEAAQPKPEAAAASKADAAPKSATKPEPAATAKKPAAKADHKSAAKKPAAKTATRKRTTARSSSSASAAKKTSTRSAASKSSSAAKASAATSKAATTKVATTKAAPSSASKPAAKKAAARRSSPAAKSAAAKSAPAKAPAAKPAAKAAPAAAPKASGSSTPAKTAAPAKKPAKPAASKSETAAKPAAARPSAHAKASAGAKTTTHAKSTATSKNAAPSKTGESKKK